MDAKPKNEDDKTTALNELAVAFLDLWEAHGAYSDAPPASPGDDVAREQGR